MRPKVGVYGLSVLDTQLEVIRFGAAPLSTVSSYWSAEAGRNLVEKMQEKKSDLLVL